MHTHELGARGEHLELELANLTRTFEELRSDTLTEAARLIAEQVLEAARG